MYVVEYTVDQVTALHCWETSLPVNTNLPELLIEIPRRQPINDLDEHDELTMKTTFSNSEQQVRNNYTNLGAMMMI